MDTHNFFVESLKKAGAIAEGVDESGSGVIENALNKVLPLTDRGAPERVGMTNGFWGTSERAAWDVIEAYWAHSQFSGSVEDYSSKIRFYSNQRPRMAQDFFGKKVGEKGHAVPRPEDVDRVFDKFFDKTTAADVTSIQVRSFLDDLRIYFNELNDVWSKSLTPEQSFRFEKARSTGLGTPLPRQTIKLAEGGNPKETPWNISFSRENPRQMLEIQDALDANYKYDFNLRNQLEALTISTQKLRNDKEYSDLFFDIDDGVSVRLHGMSGKLAAFYGPNGAGVRTAEIGKFVDDIKTRTDAIEKKYSDDIAKLCG